LRYLVNRIQLEMLVAADGKGIETMIAEFEKAQKRLIISSMADSGFTATASFLTWRQRLLCRRKGSRSQQTGAKAI
jgi:hypothetical protein